MFKNKSLDHEINLDYAVGILDLKLRSILYTFILENPGMHFREMVRKLNIPGTTLIYHLRLLEKNDLLITKKDGRYIRYFVSNNVNDDEKTVINIIRQETTRNILLYIVLTAAASQKEIAKELELHPTTVEFHLKKLLKSDLIEPADMRNGVDYTCYHNHAVIQRKPVKNEVVYKLKQPIYRYLIKYYNTRDYKNYISEALLCAAENAYPGNRLPNKVMTFKERLELLEKIIFEIFPHPYYQ